METCLLACSFPNQDLGIESVEGFSDTVVSLLWVVVVANI